MLPKKLVRQIEEAIEKQGVCKRDEFLRFTDLWHQYPDCDFCWGTNGRAGKPPDPAPNKFYLVLNDGSDVELTLLIRKRRLRLV